MEKKMDKRIILGKTIKIKPVETPVHNGILIYNQSGLSLCANAHKYINFFNIKMNTAIY